MSANTNRLGQLQKRTGSIAGKRDGGVKAKVDVGAIMTMIDRLEQEIQVMLFTIKFPVTPGSVCLQI